MRLPRGSSLKSKLIFHSVMLHLLNNVLTISILWSKLACMLVVRQKYKELGNTTMSNRQLFSVMFPKKHQRYIVDRWALSLEDTLSDPDDLCLLPAPIMRELTSRRPDALLRHTMMNSISDDEGGKLAGTSLIQVLGVSNYLKTPQGALPVDTVYAVIWATLLKAEMHQWCFRSVDR